MPKKKRAEFINDFNDLKNVNDFNSLAIAGSLLEIIVFPCYK